MEWFLQIFLPIFITQVLVVIIPIIGRRLENRPEWKRIKQEMADKKEQVETCKNNLVNIACSKLAWEEKQKMIDFYKEELTKLKDEITKLNKELPEKQKENIKLNVSEIISAVDKLTPTKKGGK